MIPEDESEWEWRIYERQRAALEQENHLLNQRMTWFITFQGFLFASIAVTVSAQATLFAASARNPAISQPMTGQGVQLITFLPRLRVSIAVVAIFLSALLLVAISGGYTRISDLEKEWNCRGKFTKLFPPIRGAQRKIFRGAAMELGLPIVVAFVWPLIVPTLATYVVEGIFWLFVAAAFYMHRQNVREPSRPDTASGEHCPPPPRQKAPLGDRRGED